MPATCNSANAIFREGRRQAEALEESIKSANLKLGRFESQGNEGRLKVDAAKAAQVAQKAMAMEDDEEREHERRMQRSEERRVGKECPV